METFTSSDVSLYFFIWVSCKLYPVSHIITSILSLTLKDSNHSKAVILVAVELPAVCSSHLSAALNQAWHMRAGYVIFALREVENEFKWIPQLHFFFGRWVSDRCVSFSFLCTLSAAVCFHVAPVGAGVTGHVCLKAGGTASFIRWPWYALSYTMWQW